MPPKPRRGVVKKKKKKVVKRDRDEHSGPTIAEMEAMLDQMKEEVAHEREQRNYFQLERDKINTFWEITKQKLADTEAALRNKDREMEEIEEKHQDEIQFYQQKVKHLLYDHNNVVAELRGDSQTLLKVQDDEHRSREQALKVDKRALKLELKETELQHEDILRNVKQEHDKNISKLRQERQRAAKELQAKYEKKMRMLREDLELRRKTEIHEIEERKNQHINQLLEKHEKAFAEIKDYYNDITLNNLELIKSLKQQVEDMKKKDAQNEKLMFEVTQENKRLSEPLQKALKEVDTLRRELVNYKKDKMSLHHSKARVKQLEDQLKQLKWAHEVLEQRFERVQGERDELYEKFVDAIQEVQRKGGMKNLMLEKKVEALNQTLERKEAQLGEVLASTNLDPGAVGKVAKKMDAILESKDKMIRRLQYDLARVTKAHNDVIRVYEAKVAEYGIPVEELGFRPLLSKTSTGPAGLVTG